MFYGAPSALLGWGFFQHNAAFTWASAAMINNPAFQGATFATIGGQFQDAERINYFTPRFMGLQIGVGYAPKINLTPIGSLAHGAAPGPVGSVCGTNDATSMANCPTNDWSWQDIFDIGANYLNKFGGVTVAVMGGFMYGSFIPGFQSSTVSLNRATGANLSNWKQWVVGAQFGYAGFTLGGSYGYDNNGLGGNWYTGQDNDTRKFTVGLMYETGPWQMSFGYVNSRNNAGNGYFNFATCTPGTSACASAGATTTNQAFGNNVFGGAANSALNFGSTTVSKFELGVNYALGPGVKLTGGAIFWNASGNAQSVAGQSWGILMGMDLRF
jgi:predicted porin